MFKKIFHELFDETTIKFFIVGVINTVFGYAIAFVLLNVFDFGFWVSTVANYFSGSVLSYFLNKRYTFRYKGGNWRVVARYALEVAVCYILSHAVAKPLCELALASLDDTLRDNIAMIVGLVFYAVINYFGQKFYVFKAKKGSD